MALSTTFVLAQPERVHIQIVGALDRAQIRKDLSRYVPDLQARCPEQACNNQAAIAHELTLRLPQGSNPVAFQVQSVTHRAVALDDVAIHLVNSDDPKAAQISDADSQDSLMGQAATDSAPYRFA
ncbi:MAG: hypothetical protein ACRER2_09660 [Methylococcales bacterium]